MEKFLVENSPPLQGVVRISGSKNSVLPILAASLLMENPCVIKEVPDLRDVDIMDQLLRYMGAHVSRDKESGIFSVQSDSFLLQEAPYELVSQMRASFLIIGPLLARTGRAKVPLPGGCNLGARPIDLHLKGFQAMGANIDIDHGYVIAKADKLQGCNIYLDFPSVGATENIMTAAVTAVGQTVIENCAVEPEIVDLANFLNRCGGDIKGAGTDTIKINGVARLKSGEISHAVIPDRIEAGTFMVGAAVTKGNIVLENVLADHLRPVIAKLKEAKITVEEREDGLHVVADKEERPAGIDVKTLPYPGFPTDMQAQFMALLTQAKGTSVVTETVFESRFTHVGELKRMGADIKIESRSAVIEGVDHLMGAQVKATDLRAGAALVLSALKAQGQTEIGEIEHIDRGYERIEEKLQKLGANIKRIQCA